MSALAIDGVDIAGFKTSYLDIALDNLEGVLARAERHLDGLDFDTLVGRGFSGGLVIPALALRLQKNFVLVRKETDDSHHHGRMIGNLGRRWIFVDDFVSSGRTRDKVLEAIRGGCVQQNHRTEYVGEYHYARLNGLTEYGEWRPGAECSECQSIDVQLNDDCTAIVNCWSCSYIPGGVQ